MLPINLDDLTPAHIQTLIDSEVAESLTLEYKEQLPVKEKAPGKEGDQKREFLYDVAAFANAVGGDIVFGVVDRTGADSQSTGVADRIAGMEIANEQSEITRLSNLIRDGIAPRLVGVQMKGVSTADGDVLVLRIPRSWSKPHMVTFGGVNKFHIRTATGKAPMSVDEIRRAFSEQGELREAIQRWRAHRAELIATGNGPVSLSGEVKMLFHVMPASAFSGDILRESWIVPEQEKRTNYVPHDLTNYRYNGDGFLCTASAGAQSEAFGYTQLFRSGLVEYADGYCYFPTPSGNRYAILGQELEKQIVKCYEDEINRLRRYGGNEIVYVSFSLVGIAEKSIYATFRTSLIAMHPIRQNVFHSPEVFVDINEPEERPYGRTLLPLIDTMWQLGGREGTPFKPGGVWNPFGQYE